MKNEDFSKKVKAHALIRFDFRCERCWSSQNLEFHRRVPAYQGGTSDLNNCVVLCSKCRGIAPDDPSLLKLFMEFASPKEMINYYGVKTEIEAIEKLCNEYGVSAAETLRKLNIASHRSSVVAGMEKKASKGEICGFNAPLGYRFRDGKLEIVENEARVVRYIFEQYAEGYALEKIVKSLNSGEIKTKKDKRWSIWAVRRILRNPIHAGYVRWNSIIQKGKHAPIIESRQFNQVQVQMNKRAIRKPVTEVLINDG